MMPELYEQIPCEHPEATGPHTTDGTHRRWLVNPPDAVCGGPSYEPVDLLAVVRRGVESGTIKGEVATRQVCEICGSMQDHVEGSFVHKARWRTEAFLVIPVSDGGSET